MPTLKEQLGSGEKRRRVIDDACQVLDQEVASKGGLSGTAIKAAYGVVKGIKAGFIPEVVDSLLDDFLDALDPVYAESVQLGVGAGTHLRANSERAAEGLLAVTDSRAERAQRAVVKKTYGRLRPTAKKHVESAMPRVADMLDRQLA
jgi:hypothetical protein